MIRTLEEIGAEQSMVAAIHRAKQAAQHIENFILAVNDSASQMAGLRVNPSTTDEDIDRAVAAIAASQQWDERFNLVDEQN